MKKSEKEKLITKLKERAASNSKRVHVVPSGEKWAVKKEGSSRASKLTSTQREAIKAADKMKFVTVVVVHKKDGTFKKSAKK